MICILHITCCIKVDCKNVFYFKLATFKKKKINFDFAEHYMSFYPHNLLNQKEADLFVLPVILNSIFHVTGVAYYKRHSHLQCTHLPDRFSWHNVEKKNSGSQQALVVRNDKALLMMCMCCLLSSVHFITICGEVFIIKLNSFIIMNIKLNSCIINHE